MIFYIRNTFMYENSLNLQSYRIATHYISYSRKNDYVDTHVEGILLGEIRSKNKLHLLSQLI